MVLCFSAYAKFRAYNRSGRFNPEPPPLHRHTDIHTFFCVIPVLTEIPDRILLPVEGAFDASKISGVGTNFGLVVDILPGPNKQRALKSSMILS
jgi:hypothetical protein